jgi:epoxyqueuosine reductase
MNFTVDVKKLAKDAGADIVGIADLAPFKNGWQVVPQDLLMPFTCAVSIAVHLDGDVIDHIDNKPTVEYADHYRAINKALDGITKTISDYVIGKGFRAQTIPASFIADEKDLLGNISHKAVARMAGIGWQGKSLLIVSPQFGPRIRLATVLTDMPLAPDGPMKNRCGACAECSKACPATAIRSVSSTGDRYETREEALNFSRCVDQTLKFKALPGIDARICGICVRVCPFGKKKKYRNEGESL